MRGGKQNMNFISVKKCKINYSRFKIKTLNLIKFSKTVSIFWKEFQSRIQERIQKFRDTICRCKNILFSKIYRVKDKVNFKGKINQYTEKIKNKIMIDIKISNEKEKMLIMLGTMSEVGGEC